MSAYEIIEILRKQNFTITTDGEIVELSPSEKLTADLLQRLRQHKPAIIEELKREQRREKVLRMLEENPNIQRAFVTDIASDSKNVILTMAVRDQYTFEITIPQHKYDSFLLLQIIERAAVQ